MKLLLFALPLFLAMISGCIFPIQPGGNGMVILTFEPSFPSVYSGEPVDFRLSVQNQGTNDATDVSTKIIGLETWNLEKNNCDGWNMIAAAVPDIGAPGDSESYSWTYEAPDLPTGLSTTHSPMVRMYYQYRSSIVKSIILASSKELRLMKDRGQVIPAQTASQTTGPLQIDIKTDAPVRFWERSVRFPVTITINNIGGGVACLSVEKCKSGNDMNKLHLDISPGNDISISECETDIDLWQGKTNTLVCMATFSGLSDIEITQRTLSIDIDYGYYIDKETQVTVTSR